ncbi:unnamed protein product [Paramecium octaurelia]|uniref:Uncharacterized protein n=1 Tax=Paramecium octaurelia TaxID=43137 RepID=A0A8S1YGM9_PAROT|nr:unnamed protein product [Paramecium octaurelia]
MQYKIKTFRKYNIDRSDLFKIAYLSPQELKPSTSCEVRRQQNNKKFTTEIENEDNPPTQIIDISKLPNGQFKDRRYMHTDETFFVKMGGKNRDLIAERLRSKQSDRQSPFKFKGTFNKIVNLVRKSIFQSKFHQKNPQIIKKLLSHFIQNYSNIINKTLVSLSN